MAYDYLHHVAEIQEQMTRGLFVNISCLRRAGLPKKPADGLIYRFFGDMIRGGDNVEPPPERNLKGASRAPALVEYRHRLTLSVCEHIVADQQRMLQSFLALTAPNISDDAVKNMLQKLGRMLSIRRFPGVHFHPRKTCQLIQRGRPPSFAARFPRFPIVI